MSAKYLKFPKAYNKNYLGMTHYCILSTHNLVSELKEGMTDLTKKKIHQKIEKYSVTLIQYSHLPSILYQDSL